MTTHRIHLPQIPPLRKMRTQTRLGAARADAAQRPQAAREAQHCNARCLWKHGRQAVEHHGCVIEYIGRQPVHFAFGLQGGAESVCE